MSISRDRINVYLLNNHPYKPIEVARDIAKKFGMKVYAEKKGWLWEWTARAVALFSDISASDFKGNFTQTFYNRIYLSKRLNEPALLWSLMCTLPHECRHGRQFREDAGMATRYLADTAYRTKQEADASIANLTMRMWRWPDQSREVLVNDVVGHIGRYGIKSLDKEALKSMLLTYVDIVDQCIDMHNVQLVCPEAAACISWFETNGFVR